MRATRPTLHVLGLPHTETTAAYASCAYTARTKDFCTYMTEAGWRVLLYAGERNEARVEQHFAVVRRSEQQAWFPEYDSSKVFNQFNAHDLPWRVFNQRVAEHLGRYAQPYDIVCVTMGVCHQDISRSVAMPLYWVETGVGYSGVWAPYRVFESHAWRHYLAAREPTDDLRWFDTVIPRGYLTDEFPVGSGGDAYLFMGRLTPRKGPQIAADVCKALGAKLLVAGPGVTSVAPGRIVGDGVTIEGDVEYLGVLAPAERAAVMGQVRAVIMPTTYLEPGGGVAMEAQLCGTPVLATPYGAMTETVIDGLTGYQCATLRSFVNGAHRLGELSRWSIARSAATRWGSRVVADRFTAYFEQLRTLEGRGWYALDPAAGVSEN